MNKFLSALLALLTLTAACGDGDDPGSSLIALPALTRVSVRPALVLHGTDTVQVTLEGAGFADVREASAQLITDGDTEVATVVLTASGARFEGVLLVEGGIADRYWIRVNLDDVVLFERAAQADTTYTRSYFDTGCQPCTQVTGVPVAVIEALRATPLTVDTTEPDSRLATAGESELFYFEAAVAGDHRIRLVGSANVDLDVCSGPPCATGTGDLGSSANPGLAWETIHVVATAGQRFLVRVTGIEEAQYAVLVETPAAIPVELSPAIPVTGESLAPGASVTYRIYYGGGIGTFTLFLHARSDRAASWTVEDRFGNQTVHSGTVHTPISGNWRHELIPITFSHDGSAPITYDIMVAGGDGQIFEALDEGDNAFLFSPEAGPHEFEFTPVTGSTYTFTATSSVMTADFTLFTSRAMTTQETFAGGVALCAHQAATGQTSCSTENPLTAGITYYLRLTATSQAESWGPLGFRVVAP